MKNVLYVDCCIRREGSRTKELAEHFLKELEKTGEYAITGLVLMDEGLNFMAEGFFRQRDELLAGKNFAHPRFCHAHQFAEADKIVIAAPFWRTIEGKTDPEDRHKCTYLRTMFPSLLITGPFSIVLGFDGGLMALNDRLKLRSMVVGEKGDKVFIASEEAAVRAMEPQAENIWAPAGGEPVIIKVKDGGF